jgi:hypothetical protein
MVKVVQSNKKFQKGDKVVTLYGKTETVLRVKGCMVSTVESAARNNWYHPTKIFKLVERKIS